MITRRQRQVLTMLIAHLIKTQQHMTVREIGAALGISSTNAAHGHLAALEAKGFIRRHNGAHKRTILMWPDRRPFRIIADVTGGES